MAIPGHAQLHDRPGPASTAGAAGDGTRFLQRHDLHQPGRLPFPADQGFGLGIPWHRDFEEVNLRFYVRRRAAEGWRRGVAFIRELVPRRAIACAARWLYGEPYTAVPMGHRIEHTGSSIHVEYRWRRGGKWESLGVLGRGEPQALRPVPTRSSSPSTTGATRPGGGGCSEYQVEHPPWRIWSGTESYLHADVLRFTASCSSRPSPPGPSPTLIAEGSEVTVRCKIGNGLI